MARRVEPSDLLNPSALREGLLALDLSSSVGWARAPRHAVLAWPADKPGTSLIASLPRPAVEWGTLKLGTGEHGARGERFRAHLEAELEAGGPGYVVIEEAIPSHRSRNRAANEMALGLRMIARSVASRHGAIVREFNVVSIKAWMTGKVHAKKPEMMAAARALGWEVGSDHEADALGILDLACARSAAAARMLGRAA